MRGTFPAGARAAVWLGLLLIYSLSSRVRIAIWILSIKMVSPENIKDFYGYQRFSIFSCLFLLI